MDNHRDALQTIATRNVFYRDGYRLLLKVALVEAAAIIVLVIALVVTALSFSPKHTFFATTSDGRLINIVPLNESFLDRANVVAWAADTSKRVMEFGFHDYRQRLQDVAPNFTLSGWESFTKALAQSRLIETLEARRQVVSTTIDGAPEVLQEGVVNGVYRWILRMPVTTEFLGTDAPQPLRTTLTLVIIRVSTLQNPNGVGIDQWIAAPR